jgi:hypothetical protein
MRPSQAGNNLGSTTLEACIYIIAGSDGSVATAMALTSTNPHNTANPTVSPANTSAGSEGDLTAVVSTTSCRDKPARSLLSVNGRVPTEN